MKKLLHIQCLPKLSGVQNISYEILKGLPSQEYDKTIMFSADGSEESKKNIIDAFKSIGVRVVFSSNLIRELNFVKDIKAFFEIYRFCRKEKFDIVHTHSSKPGVVGRIAATFAKVPYVVHTVHGLSFHKFVKFPKWQFYFLCEMFASLFCKKIVLVNKFYGKYFHLFKNKTSTIYNAVNYEKFAGIEQKQNNDERINVLFVGRLDAQKNPLCLLRSARIVISKNSSVHFTLVGDGEFYSECKRFITENNLSDNIYLAGWQKNPGIFYADADVFAASSIYEAFGLMFVEAGYFSLPVCATNVEGVPEVVQEGVSGFLCEPNDDEALAENILKFCNDKELRQNMGKESYRIATELFTINAMIQGYRKLYEE